MADGAARRVSGARKTLSAVAVALAEARRGVDCWAFHHKRCTVQHLVGAQCFQQLQPGQHGHIPVRQNHIHALLAQQLERLGTVVGHQDVGSAQRAQLVADHLAHGLDVIYHQKYCVTKVDRHGVLCWAGAPVSKRLKPPVCRWRR